MFDEEIRVSNTLIKGLHDIDLWSPFKVPNTPDIEDSINKATQVWETQARPQLFQQRENGATIDTEIFNSYTGALNHLKDRIEDYRVRYLWQMRYLQTLIIALAIGSLFVILFLLKRWVIRPVNKLGEVIDKVRAGDLSARVNVGTNDEFGRIGEGFNRMASRARGSLRQSGSEGRGEDRFSAGKEHEPLAALRDDDVPLAGRVNRRYE